MKSEAEIASTQTLSQEELKKSLYHGEAHTSNLARAETNPSYSYNPHSQSGGRPQSFRPYA